MNMLSLIRWIYPQSFVERFGEEWMATAEDLMAVAKRRGRLETFVQLIMLTVDAGVWGNVLRWRLIQEAVMGTPPVLAGAGIAGGSVALINHWGVRPVRGVINGIHQHIFAVLVGICLSTVLYYALDNHIYQDHNLQIIERGFIEHLGITAWIMTGFVATGFLTHLMTKPKSNPKSSMKQHGVIGFLMLLIVTVMVTSPINDSFSFVLPGMFLLGLSGWFLSKKYDAWQHNGFPLMLPMASCLLGLYVGIHTLFIYDIIRLGKSPEIVESFVAYPHLKNYPAAYPNDHFDTPHKWTTEQQQWFWIDPERPEAIRVQPQKLAQWCAMKMGSIKTEEVLLRSSPNEGLEIATLLWKGRLSSAVAEGCISSQEMLAQQSAMAQYVQQAVSRTTRVWEPLASWSVLIGQITSSRYIIMPRLIPNIQTYCQTMSSELVAGGQLDKGRVVDNRKLIEMCDAQENTMRPLMKKPEPSRWETFQIQHNHTQWAKNQAAQIKPVQPEELDVLRQYLLSHVEEWTVARDTPKTTTAP